MSDKLKETLIKSSTRSVPSNLARRFNAGDQVLPCPRRVATIEYPRVSNVATRLKLFSGLSRP